MLKFFISVAMLAVLWLAFISANAQTIPNYYIDLSAAQEQFIKGEYKSAIESYKQLLEKYNYPFYEQIVEAATIAFLTEDIEELKHFLKLGLSRGMNKQELLYLSHKYQSDSGIIAIHKNYDNYRQQYAAQLDSTLIIKLLNLGIVAEDINDLSYKVHRPFIEPSFSYFIPKLRNEMAERFDEKQGDLIDEFVDLVEEYGFPDQKKIGLRGGLPSVLRTSKEKYQKKHSVEECTVFKVTHYREHMVKKPKKTYITCEHNSPVKYYYQIPGGNYLIHALAHENLEKNNKVLSTLKQAYEELKLSRKFYLYFHEITRAYEKLNEVTIKQSIIEPADFYLTIKSTLAYDKEFKYSNVCLHAGHPKLEPINKNRENFGYRTIPKEVELIERIYLLLHGEKPAEITEEVLYTVGPYLHYFDN